MIYNTEISEDKNVIDASIIIPCKNEMNNLKWTLDSLIKSQNNLRFEIIVVDDGSQDNSTEFLENDLKKKIYKNIFLIKTNNLGASEARNAGAHIAKGKYLFFCDCHVKVPHNWLDNLVNTLKNFNADLVAPCITSITNPLSAGYGETWTDKLKVKWFTKKPKEGTEIPIAGGAALGITKEAFEKINGFDHLFKVWGKEDEEICLKAWLYGYKIVINPDVHVEHLFRKKHPYRVTNINVGYNTLCLAYSHFNTNRLDKTINIVKRNFPFKTLDVQIRRNQELIFQQREKYFKERIHDDNFFFKKFNIPF